MRELPLPDGGRPEDPRPPSPTGLTRLLFRLPIALYRARLGRLLGRRFVLVHHRGRRSGLPREVVVEVVAYDRAAPAVTVASGFGRSDWYRNLRASPDTTIQLGAHTHPVTAHFLSPEEGAEAMESYARRHPRTARRLARFMGFAPDGTLDGYRRVGERIPFVRFEPRRARSGPGGARAAGTGI